jgi:uncharacterized membrane protein YeaQ/YmgE (transglycosylase-associated protein family)
MGETAGEVVAYLQGSIVLSLGIALLAGFAGSKTVSTEARWGFFLYLLVGGIGLFLSQFVIRIYGFQEYLENVPEFRLLFDFIAAYIGSFFVAAITHFVKPT